jgi:regulatory protein
MNKITGIKTGRSREKRIDIYLDGKLSLNLLTEVALKEHLRVGQELTAKRLETLSARNNQQRCFNAAVRYLGYRPRSESEVKQRLHRHGFNDAVTEAALAKLKEQGLIDDGAFARFWTENRDSFSPRSRRQVQMELKLKGVPANVSEPAIGAIDETESAYRAAMKKVKHLPLTDYAVFRRNLGMHLVRRGFNYDIINETVNRVWKEQRGNNNQT